MGTIVGRRYVDLFLLLSSVFVFTVNLSKAFHLQSSQVGSDHGFDYSQILRKGSSVLILQSPTVYIVPSAYDPQLPVRFDTEAGFSSPSENPSFYDRINAGLFTPANYNCHSNDKKEHGYCTSPSACLNSYYEEERSKWDKYFTFIQRLFSIGVPHFSPTCLYVSDGGQEMRGICCQRQHVIASEPVDSTTDLAVKPNISREKDVNPTHSDSANTEDASIYASSSGDNERSNMDRGHIFFGQGGPPRQEISTTTEQIIDKVTWAPDKRPPPAIVKDEDDKTENHFFPSHNIHPTHPPLPTHPPEHTNKPWWTTTPPGGQSKWTTTTTTTTTTRRTSRRPFWWEIQTTTTRPHVQTPWIQTTKSTTKWWNNQWTTTPKPWQLTQRTTTVRTTSSSKATTTTTKFPTQPNGYCSPSSSVRTADMQDFELKGQKITGGGPVSPHSLPWMAIVVQGRKHICGGSLVDEFHILTAAHCVASLPSWLIAQMRVVLGVHNLRMNEASRQEYKIKTVIRHKEYSRRLLYNDVAILTLEKPVKFTDKVQPICLYSGNDNFLNQTAMVAGWGSLYEGGHQLDTPRQVVLRIWSNSDCRDTYGYSAPGGIVDSYMCAGQQGKDACSGDSGGPIVKHIGGVWQQIGIVSWGIGCGKAYYPGVYSRMSTFLPWIDQVRAKY